MAHLARTSLLLFAHLVACVSTTSGTQGAGRDAAAGLDHDDVATYPDVVDAAAPFDTVMVPDAIAEMDVPPILASQDIPPSDRIRVVGDAIPVERQPCEGVDCSRAVELQLSSHSGLIRVRDGSYRAWGDVRVGLVGPFPPEVDQIPLPITVIVGEQTRAFLGFLTSTTIDRLGVIRQWREGRVAAQYAPPFSEITSAHYAGQFVVLSSDGRIVIYPHEIGSNPVFFPATPSDVSMIAGSMWTTCVGGPSGVWCWGLDDYGQLGDNVDRRASDSPVRVAIPGGQILGATQISGSGTRCAIIRRDLQNTAEVWCWGRFAHHFAESTIEYRTAAGERITPIPVLVPELDGARRLAVAADALCAVMPDGTVRCTGANNWGQIGMGSASERETWTTVPGLRNVVDIANAESAFCALTTEGEVWCWGTTDSPVLRFARPGSIAVVPPTRIRWQ